MRGTHNIKVMLEKSFLFEVTFHSVVLLECFVRHLKFLTHPAFRLLEYPHKVKIVTKSIICDYGIKYCLFKEEFLKLRSLGTIAAS
jgi:hypothetical protein